MPVRQRAILIAAGAGGGIPTRPGRSSYADGYAAGSAGPEDRRTVSVELIILIIVLLLLLAGEDFTFTEVAGGVRRGETAMLDLWAIHWLLSRWWC